MPDKDKTIPIASDHAGFALKEFLIGELERRDYHIEDLGTHSEDSVDYPDFIHPLAREVDKGKYEFGIIICGSGQGANMVANKYRNVRSALCWDEEQAELSRRHNNANIIALPGRFLEKHRAALIVETFLNTGFEGGRHERRIEKIPPVEKNSK